MSVVPHIVKRFAFAYRFKRRRHRPRRYVAASLATENQQVCLDRYLTPSAFSTLCKIALMPMFVFRRCLKFEATSKRKAPIIAMKYSPRC